MKLDYNKLNKELSKSSTPKVVFWKKTIFWENIKRTCAVGGGPTTYGIHEFGGADHWMMAAALLALFGAGISIWFTDNDSNGVVDLFQ